MKIPSNNNIIYMDSGYNPKPQKTSSNSSPAFSHLVEKRKKPFNPTVALFATLGTIIPMLLMRNKKLPVLKSLWDFEYGIKSIISMGLGAVAGGVLGGVIHDKGKGTDKKLREGIHQSMANIILPSALAHYGIETLQKHGIKNKFAKSGVVLAAVSGGMLLGGKIAGFVNKKLFPHLQCDRKIVLRDTLVHVDDLPTVLVLAKEKFFGIEKLVPVGALLSGYEAGIGRGHYHTKCLPDKKPHPLKTPETPSVKA